MIPLQERGIMKRVVLGYRENLPATEDRSAVQMHELAAMKSVHDIVLQHANKASANKVLSVNLEIGTLSDLQDEWVYRYFDHLSRGTVAEGATVEIVRVPGKFRCSVCEALFEVHSLTGKELSCSHCSSNEVDVVSGQAIQVKGIEVV